MGEVIDISRLYKKEYGSRIREIEARIARYETKIQELLGDLLDSAQEEYKEVNEQDLFSCQQNITILKKELARLQDTLKSLNFPES